MAAGFNSVALKKLKCSKKYVLMKYTYLLTNFQEHLNGKGLSERNLLSEAILPFIYPCGAHCFFPKGLFNLVDRFHLGFAKLYTKFNAEALFSLHFVKIENQLTYTSLHISSLSTMDSFCRQEKNIVGYFLNKLRMYSLSLVRLNNILKERKVSAYIKRFICQQQYLFCSTKFHDWNLCFRKDICSQSNLRYFFLKDNVANRKPDFTLFYLKCFFIKIFFTIQCSLLPY